MQMIFGNVQCCSLSISTTSHAAAALVSGKICAARTQLNFPLLAFSSLFHFVQTYLCSQRGIHSLGLSFCNIQHVTRQSIGQMFLKSLENFKSSTILCSSLLFKYV